MVTPKQEPRASQSGSPGSGQDKRRPEVRSERGYRAVLDNIPVFVVALDPKGRIVLWNRCLEEATGYLESDMLGVDGRPWIGDDGTDRRIPLREGGHRLVRWQRTDGAGGEEEGLSYAIGHDVTYERESLRRSLRGERLAAVGTLAAGLAHEVRNPLNSAQLQIDLLERRLARGAVSTESILSTSRILRDELGRLERLVSDFLAFAQPRPLEMSVLPANDVVSAVVELVRPEVADHELLFTVSLDPYAGRFEGDPARLRQVLLNLVRNAIEASPPGGMLSLCTHRPDERGNVVIEVKDTGAGIPEDAPIFDAFYTTKEGGTGLGLSIVHRIVTDHGGTISFESVPGQTRFLLSLPEHPGLGAGGIG